MTHNSLLVISWDESWATTEDPRPRNHIPTLFTGPLAKAGSYAGCLSHVDTPRTLVDGYGLPYAGGKTSATPIMSIWNTTSPAPRLARSNRSSTPGGC